MGLDQEQLSINQTAVFDQLTCTICQSIFERPKELPCKHLFCEDCIFLWTRRSKPASCPICRAIFSTLEVAKPASLIMGILDTLIWRCEYQGCNITTSYSNIRGHKTQCPFRIVHCPYPGCNRRVRRLEIAEHLYEHRKGHNTAPRQRSRRRRWSF